MLAVIIVWGKDFWMIIWRLGFLGTLDTLSNTTIMASLGSYPLIGAVIVTIVATNIYGVEFESFPLIHLLRGQLPFRDIPGPSLLGGRRKEKEKE